MSTSSGTKAFLLHEKMGKFDKSEKLPPLKFESQLSRAVPDSQSMVAFLSFDVPLVHPPLLGCDPLNTCELFVLYDNGMSGIDPVKTNIYSIIYMIELRNKLQYLIDIVIQ